MLVWILVIIGVVALDQGTKILVMNFLDRGEPLEIIKGVFRFTYVENTGAAMGMFSDNRWVFMIISTVALIVMSVYLFKFCKERMLTKIGLALVARKHFVLIAVKFDETPDEVPDFFVVGVEYVRAVGVDFDAAFRVGFAAHVAAGGMTLFQHQNFTSGFGQSSCHGAAPDSGARHYRVYFFHGFIIPQNRSVQAMPLMPVLSLTTVKRATS